MEFWAGVAVGAIGVVGLFVGGWIVHCLTHADDETE